MTCGWGDLSIITLSSEMPIFVNYAKNTAFAGAYQEATEVEPPCRRRCVNHRECDSRSGRSTMMQVRRQPKPPQGGSKVREEGRFSEDKNTFNRKESSVRVWRRFTVN